MPGPHDLADLRGRLADPRRREAALLELQDRLARCREADELDALATLVPTRLEGLRPELQLRLAAMHLTVRTWREGHVLPDWRPAGPEPAVAHAWLRLELRVAPRSVRLEEPATLAALRSLRGHELREPGLLVRLCAHPQSGVQQEGLRLLNEAVLAGLLAPDLAGECLLALLNGPGPIAQAGALRLLASPWALAWGLRCPRGPLLRRLADDDRDAALAAVQLAALYGLTADLRALAEDPDAEPDLRIAAFTAGASRCERDSLTGWLALAVTDPPLFGAACMSALRALHRRAIFVTERELPALLELAADDDELDLEALAALCYTARQPLIRRLRSEVPGEPRWPRWAALVAALDCADAPTLLRDLLGECRDPRLRRQLIGHLGELGDVAAEAVVLAQLEREPAACLAALRTIGGEDSIAALERGLGLHDDAGVRPHLRADVSHALALLWHLYDEQDPRREALRARLRPTKLPPEIARDLGAVTPPHAWPLLLASAPGVVSALERLAAQPSRGAVPIARDLLRRAVSEVVAGRLVDRDEPPASREHTSQADRQIPRPALLAIQSLGERLFERAAVRLDETAAAAGQRLQVDLLLDLLAELEDPESLAIVLTALTPLGGRRINRRVHGHLRHPDPRVRAAAVVCLARHGPDDLTASLTQLVAADDLATARQAVVALGEVRASAAAPAIAACLEHPNMNLKKAAAEALGRLAAPEVAPALLRWLGQHDNPGLRAALSTALRASVGEAVTAALIAALDEVPVTVPDAARRWKLLCQALDGLLTPAAVLAASRRGAPWVATALASLSQGKIDLASGELAELAAILPTTAVAAPPAPQLRPAITRLLAHGLDDATATAVLADPVGLRPPELAAVRPYLREWLAALPAGLTIVLQLAAAGLDAHERRLLARSVDPVSAMLDVAPREPLLGLLDLAISGLAPADGWLLADRLRACTPAPNLAGTSWLGRLRRCGVVLTRADLERALHDCAGTPDPAQLERCTLRDALGLPAPEPAELRLEPGLPARVRDGEVEPAELSPRLLCELYPEVPADRRGAWLTRLLQLRPLDVASDPPPSPQPARHRPQPRSRAALERLRELLDRPLASERSRAAALLLEWRRPEADRLALAAYLRGDLEPSHRLAKALARDLAVVESGEHDLPLRARLLALLPMLPLKETLDLAPTLVRWWSSGPAAQRDAVAQLVRSLPADPVLTLIEPDLRAGRWGALDVLGNHVLATPGWLALIELAEPGLAEVLRARTLPAPLAPTGAAEARAALLDLRTPLPDPPTHLGPDDLRERLGDADPEAVRAALSDMSQRPGPDWLDLLDRLIDHPSPRVRLHAHRLLRQSDARERYLACTLRLLDDPVQDTRRMAMRTLSHAAYAPAVAPLIDRLVRERDPLHGEVALALRRLGPVARDALVRARGRARPDRRARFDELLAAIAADHPE